MREAQNFLHIFLRAPRESDPRQKLNGPVPPLVKSLEVVRPPTEELISRPFHFGEKNLTTQKVDCKKKHAEKRHYCIVVSTTSLVI